MRPNTVLTKAIHASVRDLRILTGAAREINNCPYHGNLCECEGP